MKDKLCNMRRNIKLSVQYYNYAIAPMRVLCGTWFVLQWMFGCCVRKITDGRWPGEW